MNEEFFSRPVGNSCLCLESNQGTAILRAGILLRKIQRHGRGGDEKKQGALLYETLPVFE